MSVVSGTASLLDRLNAQHKDSVDLKALFKEHPKLRAQVIKVDERPDSRAKSCVWITLGFELGGKQVKQEFKYSPLHFDELAQRMKKLGLANLPILEVFDWEAVSFTVGYPRYYPVALVVESQKKLKP